MPSNLIARLQHHSNSTNNAGERRSRLLINLGLFLGTIAIYWPVLHHQFSIFDDINYVSGNPHVTGGLTAENLKWAFTAFYAGNWHPLTWISHMLDWALYGNFAGGHHLTSVLFHAINSLLLFAWLRVATGKLFPSALVAALFAWHPFHVESVAWIAERKDVLSTCFFLLTLIAYTRFVHSKRHSYYAWALFCFALGLMSKPMLVTLPCLLLVLDYWPLQRWKNERSPDSRVQEPQSRLRLGRRLLLEKIPFLLLGLASCVVTVLAQHQGHAIRTFEEYSLPHRLLACVAAYGIYLWKTFWPVNLCMYYLMPDHLPVIEVLSGTAIILFVWTIAFIQRKNQPWIIAGLAWFFGTLIPVIGLLQVGGQEYADRYTYIPQIGLLIAVIWTADFLLSKSRAIRWRIALSGAVLAASISVTGQLIPTWQDSITIFQRITAVTTGNYFAENEFGILLVNAGDPPAGVAHLNQALKINPKYEPAHYFLGLEYENLSDYANAELHFKTALQLQPNAAEVHRDFGALLGKLHRMDAAIDELQQATRLNPADGQAWDYLAISRQKAGSAEKALDAFNQAQKLEPDNVGIANRRAYLMASYPDAPVRDVKHALVLAGEVVKMTRAAEPHYLGTLALAQAANGDFSNAVVTADLALSLELTHYSTNLTARIKIEAASFREGKLPVTDWKEPLGFQKN